MPAHVRASLPTAAPRRAARAAHHQQLVPIARCAPTLLAVRRRSNVPPDAGTATARLHAEQALRALRSDPPVDRPSWRPVAASWDCIDLLQMPRCEREVID
jgi:hypothetical protein